MARDYLRQALRESPDDTQLRACIASLDKQKAPASP
jgi:hypothetical protein